MLEIEKIYHKNIKRPICRWRISQKRNSQARAMHTMNNQQLVKFHMADILPDDMSDDPYERIIELPKRDKLRHCHSMMRDLHYKVEKYLPFTSHHLKREDIYQMLLLRKEMQALGWKPKEYEKMTNTGK